MFPGVLVRRRQFLRQAVALTAGAAWLRAARSEAAPGSRVLETRTISLDDRVYHGWPTLTRRKNGDLWVVYSGGREQHVCPFGRVDLMVSHDEGQTWGWPRTLLDTDLDDRDAGVVETAQGTMLVSTFTSLAYEAGLAAAQHRGNWPPERLRRWQAAHQRLSAEQRKWELGVWIIRSTDGGRTWSPRQASLVNSPHGPIQLANGRLLYAGKELWSERQRVGVCESLDDGQSWRWLAELPARAGDQPANYHELHAVECLSGRLVVQIRNHNPANANETLQSESADGGRTWSTPHEIGVWGLPSHLLRLADGRLLMTYGYRRVPFGNQARVSTDEGRTWSGAITISADGGSGDLGYPSTVELRDGTLVTVWYEALPGRPFAVLRQARWKLDT